LCVVCLLQGPWDGWGGLLKRDARNSVIGQKVMGNGTSKKRINNATQFYNHCKAKYGTAAWGARSVTGKVITLAKFFLWPGNLERPLVAPLYTTLKGIRTTYQFFMLYDGTVLHRREVCCCLACLDVVPTDKEGVPLADDYIVAGCANPALTFEMSVIREIERAGLAVTRQNEARAVGRKLATDVNIGDWLAVASRADATERFWLCKAIEYENSNGPIHRFGYSTTIDGTRYDPNDHLIAVRFYERDPADPAGCTFVQGNTGGVNSCELRTKGFTMSGSEYGELLPAATAAGIEGRKSLHTDIAAPYDTTKQVMVYHTHTKVYYVGTVDAAGERVAFAEGDHGLVDKSIDDPILPMVTEGSLVTAKWIIADRSGYDKARVFKVAVGSCKVVFIKDGVWQTVNFTDITEPFKAIKRTFKVHADVAMHRSLFAEVAGDSSKREYWFGKVVKREPKKGQYWVQLECKPTGELVIVTARRMCLRREVEQGRARGRRYDNFASKYVLPFATEQSILKNVVM